MKESRPESSLRRMAELRAALAGLPKFHDTKSPTDKIVVPTPRYFAVTLTPGEPCEMRPMTQKQWQESTPRVVPTRQTRRELEDSSSWNG